MNLWLLGLMTATWHGQLTAPVDMFVSQIPLVRQRAFRSFFSRKYGYALDDVNPLAVVPGGADAAADLRPNFFERQLADAGEILNHISTIALLLYDLT